MARGPPVALRISGVVQVKNEKTTGLNSVGCWARRVSYVLLRISPSSIGIG